MPAVISYDPAAMERVDACVGCGGKSLRPVYRNNDLTHLDKPMDPRWRNSDFVICQRCGLLFAQWRQTKPFADHYYSYFAEYEHRFYNQFPLPETYVQGKHVAAGEVISLMQEQGVVDPRQRVLQLRCDCGAFLARLRDEFGYQQLFGLDYFDTNIRYAREILKLENIGKLSAADLNTPFGQQKYDLIISNHQITHAFRPAEWLVATRALLAPGGTVVFYNEQDHARVFRSRGLNRGINNFHKQLLTERSFTNLAAIAGLDARLIGLRKNTMVFAARACEPVAAAAITDSGSAPLERAVQSWIANQHSPTYQFMRRVGRAAKRLLRVA